MSDRYGNIPIEPVSTGTTPPTRSRRSRQRRKRSDSSEISPQMPDRKQGPRRNIPKSLMLAAFALCLFCGYLAAGFWGVPKYIRTSLADMFQEQTGMLVDFDQVQFNPFSFMLDISGITIHEGGIHSANETDTPLLTVSSFSAGLAPLQLLRGELVTTNLAIDNFNMHLVRHEDGNYNFSSLRSEENENKDDQILDFSDLPFRFSLNNIAVHNSRILFEDKPKRGTHIIEKIDLTLPNLSNFSFAAKNYIHPSFKAVVNGSPIEMTGQAVISGDNTAGMQTNLECTFEDIDLPLYLGYLPIQLPFEVKRGKADATFNLSFSPTATEKKLLVNFSIQAEDASVTGIDKSFVLEIPSSKLEGAIQPVTGDTHFKNILLRQPELRVNSKIALFDAMAALGSTKIRRATDPENSPGNDHQVIIDLLLADSGSLIFTDSNNTAQPDSWAGIQASLKNYSSTPRTQGEQTSAAFLLAAEKSDREGAFKWQGKLNHDNLPDGELSFTGADAAWLFKVIGLESVGASQGTVDTQAHIKFISGLDEGDKPRLNIADASLTLHDFSAKQGKTVWYSSPETQISGFSKEGFRISLGSITTKDASVNLTAGKLPSILNTFNDKESATSIDTLDFNGSIAIQSGDSSQPQLQFTDAKLQTIRLAKNDNRESRDNSTFQAKLNGSGKIQAKGLVQLQPFSARYSIDFSNINTSKLLPRLSNSTFIDSIDATLSGSGEFMLPQPRFEGLISLDKGAIRGQNTKYLSWQKVELKKFKYRASPLHISAAELTLDNPRLSLAQSYGDKHFLAELHAYFQANIAKPLYKAAGKNGAVLNLDQIRVTGGSASYADTRLSPVWKGEFSDIDGRIESLNSASNAKPALFSFSGKLDSVPFEYEGALSLFSSKMNGDSTFTVTDLPLPSFHEQLADQLDIDTSKGLVSVTGTAKWTKGSMKQHGEMVFQDVEPLSETSDSALPLALIADEEDKFTLTAENSQPDSSKPFNLYADAVLSLKKMIVKASVSPLLLASGNFSDLVGNEYADFLPGEIVLSGKGREALSRFSNLLATHPYIGITVTGLADPVVDGKELKQALEELEKKRVAEENRKRSEQLNKETEEYFRKAAEARIAAGETGQVVEEDLPVDLYTKYAPIEPEPIVIDESMLLQLADQRAKVIASFLVENLDFDAKRIRINNQSQVSQNEISPGNRVQFSIEPFTQNKSRQ